MKVDLSSFLPPAIARLENPQTDIPRIAKDGKLTTLIEGAVRSMPTTHDLILRFAIWVRSSRCPERSYDYD